MRVTDYAYKVSDGNWGLAVNAAINAALSLGTNNVKWPEGNYSASGIILKSGITLESVGVVNISHPNGTDGTHIFTAEEIATTGSVTAGGNQLLVANGLQFAIGDRLSIRGAGVPSIYQFGTLASTIGALDNAFSLVNVFNDSADHFDGWIAALTFVWIDNELLSYSTHVNDTNAFSSVQRGLYGTIATSHTAGATVSLALVQYAQVTGISGNILTLDTTAYRGVTNSVVMRGSQDITVRGFTMNGLKPVVIQGAKSHGVEIGHGRNVLVENCNFNNFAHSGVNTDRNSRSINEFNCNFDGCGYPALPDALIGAGTWAFRGAQLITNNCSFSNCNIGIYWDDRTGHATEFDYPSSDCSVLNSTFFNNTYGIQNNGGSNEIIDRCSFDQCFRGVLLIAGWQGTQAVPLDNQIVRDCNFANAHSGIYIGYLTTNVTQTGNTFTNCDVDVMQM